MRYRQAVITDWWRNIVFLVPGHYSGNLPGKEGMSSETELSIILTKLKHPDLSGQQMVKALELHCSRFTVNRVFSRWGITDRNRKPVALDRYCPQEKTFAEVKFQPTSSVYPLYSEESLLESRRINRHFELICER